MPKKSITSKNTKEMKDFIGGHLKYLRSRFGYTQDYVANYLSVTRTTYTKWETGVSQIEYGKESSFICAFLATRTLKDTIIPSQGK